MAESEAKTSAPTRRVVLKLERVLVLPAGLTDEQLKELAGALGMKRGKPETIEAWVPVGTYLGAAKLTAIEQYAGKAGTPDAIVGEYRAPAESAWRGREIYEAPPQPLVQRRTAED